MRRDRVLSSSKAGEVAKRRREEEIAQPTTSRERITDDDRTSQARGGAGSSPDGSLQRHRERLPSGSLNKAPRWSSPPAAKKGSTPSQKRYAARAAKGRPWSQTPRILNR